VKLATADGDPDYDADAEFLTEFLPLPDTGNIVKKNPGSAALAEVFGLGMLLVYRLAPPPHHY